MSGTRPGAQALRHSGGVSGGPPAVKEQRPFAQMRNLVKVACHAVFTGVDYTKPLDFDSWFLLDYQKVHAVTDPKP